VVLGRLAPSPDRPPEPTATMSLVTDDGVRISAAYWRPSRPDGPGCDSATAFVIGHGFTGSWESRGLRRAAGWFAEHGGVVAVSFRGHRHSGGRSTLGGQEVLDLEAGVRWARTLGYARVVSVGFSMGGSVVVRHAGLIGGVDAVVSVSAPARWYYRGTPRMRVVHWAISEPTGRLVVRLLRRTRVVPGWEVDPVEPRAAAASIAPTRLLVVHGDLDPYFPLDHAHQLASGAGDSADLWVERDYGHAERVLPEELAHRIALWGLDAARSD